MRLGGTGFPACANNTPIKLPPPTPCRFLAGKSGAIGPPFRPLMRVGWGVWKEGRDLRSLPSPHTISFPTTKKGDVGVALSFFVSNWDTLVLPLLHLLLFLGQLARAQGKDRAGGERGAFPEVLAEFVVIVQASQTLGQPVQVLVIQFVDAILQEDHVGSG